jgi:hypothetical protein
MVLSVTESDENRPTGEVALKLKATVADTLLFVPPVCPVNGPYCISVVVCVVGQVHAQTCLACLPACLPALLLLLL